MKKLILAISCSLMILAGLPLCAQENPNLDVGFRPFGSFEGSEFDTISIGTRNVSIFYPIASWPQRGSQLKASLSLLYNNKAWGVRETCNLQTGTCTFKWQYLGGGVYAKGSVRLIVSTGALNISTRTVKGAGGQNLTLYSAVTEDGATHQLSKNTNSASGMESIDATGIWYGGGISYPPYTGTLTDKRGVLNGLQDTNGNYITLGNPTTDTLGRNLTGTIVSTDSTGCPSNSTSWNITNYPGYNGGNLSVKSCYATYALQTNFQAEACDVTNGECGIATEGTASTQMLVGVVLYNGASWASSPAWSFDYVSRNPGDPSNINYGDLSKVTVPSGGTITYTWGTDNLCEGGTPLVPVSRVLTSRTVDANDGTGPHTTTYKYNAVPVGVLATDPAGNDTVHGFAFYGSTYETQTKYYKGSYSTGTLLKTVGTDYQTLPNPFASYSDCPTSPELPIRVTTTWPNNLVNKVETDYDTYSGNITENREYDYGNGAPGALLRKTDYSYQQGSNPNYLNANILNLATQKTVYNGSSTKIEQTTYTYDGTTLQSSGVIKQHNSLANPGYRGNLTLVQKWLNATGGSVTTKQTSYFDTGMPYQSTDLKGNQATYSYDSAYYGAYGTQTQLPTTYGSITHIIKGAYDFNTGKLTTFTDQNNQPSSYGYDSLWRVNSASFPNGGSTSITYTDTFPVQISKTVKITSSLSMQTNSVFDGLGRISQTQLNDPNCTTGSKFVKVDHTYKPDTTQNTWYSTVTTPYCDTPGTTFGLSTRTDADALGRTAKVTQTDGSIITTSYNANCTTVTDEAGKSRTSCADGLGRMTGVWEDPSHLNYETDYTYDAMNNLLSVAQKGGDSNSAHWRPRSFIYDSLSRLASATNPESGTISYTYSNDSSGCSGDPGAVCTKTAPSPNQASTGTAKVTTTYTYNDALNRITQKSYADGYQNNTATPTAFFVYDYQSSWGVTQNNVVGRLSEQWTGTSCCATAGAEIFGYDPMGRILVNEQFTPNMGYMPVNYTYDFAGDMTTATNGVGVTLTYGYDAATRPVSLTSSLSDSQHPATLATVDSANGYYPNGALRKLTYGNGLTATSAYNNRLQPCRLNVNSSSTALGTCSDTPSGTVLDFSYGFNLGTTDNGNLVSWVGTGNQTFNRTYAYDGLNRLFTLTDSASNQACKGLQWTYDPWGNMTSQAVTSGSCLTFSASATTQNQLVGYTYDAAGNMTRDGSHTYFYDAENRLIQVDGTLGTCSTATACYAYDAEGRRVEKLQGSTWSDRVYDLGGRVETEVGNGGVWDTGYVYFGGQLLAEYINSTTYFASSDHLGSTRLMTGVNASVYDSMDYLPFGAQIAGDTGTTHKFTGKERDSESGLDYFGKRFHASSLGRFISVDPHDIVSDSNKPDKFRADLLDPARWNRYAYVTNNPLKYADWQGLEKYLVVYVQQPVPGTSATWTREGMSANTGHSFIGLKDTTAHTEVKAGFYPKGTVMPVSPETTGVIKDDANHSWNVKQEYKITDDQYKAVQQSISNDKADTNLQYDLNTNNCTDWVMDEAAKAGISLPDATGTWPDGGGQSPGPLGQELASQPGATVQHQDGNGNGSSSSSSGSSNLGDQGHNAGQGNAPLAGQMYRQ